MVAESTPIQTETTQKAETENAIKPPPTPIGLLKLLARPDGYQILLEKLKVLPHHTISIPKLGQMIWLIRNQGEQALLALLDKRNRLITLETADPFNHGYRSQQWKDADQLRGPSVELFVSGTNRSSKSFWAAEAVMRTLGQANKIVWCMSPSEERSKDVQQRYIWHYMPLPWRDARRARGIKHNDRTRFSDNHFVTPSGSECLFKNCNQDPESTIEGGQADLIWIDEKIDVDRLTRLRGRTVDRNGEIIWTYTPIDGYTMSVAEFFDGSIVDSWQECPAFAKDVIWRGGKAGMMPKVLSCVDPKRKVIFFDARQNPFINYESLVQKWSRSPRSIRLARLAGITERVAGSVFPRFGRHNIVPHGTVEASFKENPPTRWHFLDFAWNRNWFMLWFGCQQIGDKLRITVYREWPDYENFGEWALPSDKPDGMRGPAQTTLGFGPTDYRRLVHQLETLPEGGREEVFMRYGDPRSGSATALNDQGATTILEMLLSDEGGVPPLIVHPAWSTDRQGTIVEGVNLINKWLEYNEDEPISVLNEPTLYISERCQNLITCVKMWTGRDSKAGARDWDKAASKDPCDLLRYAAMVGIGYVDPEREPSFGGGSY